ncbi:MAG TPA: phosphatidylserine decarboxylase [Blastocatellia bacterium]|nr:phosphatidylserine decarboxylase [Blastocatellia bacterium]
MVKEGIPSIVVFLIPAVVFSIFGWWIAAGACLALALFMAFFFRDPARQCPTGEGLIVSPADGRVVFADKVEPSQPDSATQISIFLSPLDVHINRSPMAGEIIDVVYKRGAFHVASKDIASVENEQNIITIRGAGFEIGVRQIAGVLARRVVLWKKKGDSVSLGERIGLMKFSSRMDVLVPDGFDVLVKKGDRVIGGITPLARRRF